MFNMQNESDSIFIRYDCKLQLIALIISNSNKGDVLCKQIKLNE